MAVMHLFPVTLIAVLLAPLVHGHGYMQRPPARQLPECNDREITRQFIPAGGTGGGVNHETMGGDAGLCGDPFINKPKSNSVESEFVNLPCQQERLVFTEGGVLDMQWMVTANHGGFFECKICDDPNNLSEECFDKWPLLTVEHNDPRWWIMTAESSRVHDLENQVEGYRGHTFEFSWHLPVGLTCEHCVVQCTWPSATHCVFPCEREVCGWYADQYNHIMRPPGASNYEHVTGFCASGLKPAPGEAPQIFKNCGDITIVPGDGSSPPPATEPMPEPVVEAVAEEPEEPETVVEGTPANAAVVEQEVAATQSGLGQWLSGGSVTTATQAGSAACGVSGQPVCTGREFECDEGFVGEAGMCVPFTEEERAMNEQMMEEEIALEEATISAAGNELSCTDSLVSSVLMLINKRRSHNGVGEVECSEKATGTAEAWAQEMCASGEVGDRENNCRLAGYSPECSEMITMSSAARPFDDLADGDMQSLRKHGFVSVGIGYASCDDDDTKAWVLLFD